MTITPPGVTPNFHCATIVRREARLALLGHQNVPLLAIAAPPPKGTMEVEFVDDPALRAALRSPDPFRLLTLDELRTPLHLAELSALHPDELGQIEYWDPATVGELTFNYWD